MQPQSRRQPIGPARAISGTRRHHSSIARSTMKAGHPAGHLGAMWQRDPIVRPARLPQSGSAPPGLCQAARHTRPCRPPHPPHAPPRPVEEHRDLLAGTFTNLLRPPLVPPTSCGRLSFRYTISNGEQNPELTSPARLHSMVPPCSELSRPSPAGMQLGPRIIASVTIPAMPEQAGLHT